MASKKTSRSAGKNGRDGERKNAKSAGKSGGSQTKLRASRSLPVAPEDSVACQIAQFCFGILAALLLLILILTDLSAGRSGSATGLVGYYLCKGLYGLFGWGVWLIPAALVYLTVFWRRALRTRTSAAKCVAAFLVVLIFSSFFYSQFSRSSETPLPKFYDIPEMWSLSFPKDGAPAVNRGGILGALFGGLLVLLFRKVAWLIELVILISALLILIELPPMRAIRAIGAAIKRAVIAIRERRARRAQEKEDGQEEDDDGSDEPDSPRSRIFPEDAHARAEDGEGKRRAGVGITPIRYGRKGEKAEDGASKVSDLPITDTVPPVLSEDAPQNPPKTDEKPAEDPRLTNVYADPEPDPGDPAGSKDGSPLDRIFTNGELDAVPVVGGDVNVTPRRPGVSDTFGQSGIDPREDSAHFAGTDAPSGPENGENPGDSDGLSDSGRENLPDPIIGRPEDENDHAMTDPDLADPDDSPVKREYKFPPLTLLATDVNRGNADNSAELRANADKLVNVLASFKVKATVTSISHGPTITRYELMPDQGVRVRAIANLVDDIALNLATSGVRIEAPIPGKSAVGIEVPNADKEIVYLRDLLENPKFKQASSKVTAALGMDVAGEPIFVDIAKMPHLLISGTTGSGKSICIHALLVSLLFRASPDEVKLIIIDPKKVDFGVYDRLPHLLVPVVTQPKKAAGALSWAVSEMERRYEIIEQAGVRDNRGYNRLIEEGEIEGESMPSIVIAIDELADLMMSAPDTVEESICRLAQKARAAGMHLIIGTQRPSVDVITGLIKANIPSRIALMLRSIADSRTIIDTGGAEKLIGNGDMLYAPVGAMKPIRVQGAFVSDKEVASVCDYIRAQYGETVYDQKTMDEIREHEAECEEIGKKSVLPSSDDNDEEDPKFLDALRVAVEEGKISTSLLQRRISLGYGRAAKIIDRMEKLGFVTPQEGQKPRNVRLTMQEYQEYLSRRES